ncbi:MAG: hypothetical protein JNL02_10455 [Saprospiraceae bacterium]|nr:hypothetical protein [Saprospiraceae bacterium]MCC7504392.1 hypothetical protein [Saprospiraceae bacterium]
MTSPKLIDMLRACAASCENCAEIAMLDGNEYCSFISQDCADVCNTAIKLQGRHSPFALEMNQVCARVALACAEECRRLALENDPYAANADACERCASEMLAMAN